MSTTTATHLPVGTRVRVVGFGQSSGLTGVVTAGEANGFGGWTFVAMDRRATAEEADLGYPNESLEALPEPTVFLVKRPARRPVGDGVEFAATHRAVATPDRVDPRVPTLAELRTAGMVPPAPVADPERFQRAVASIARSAKLAETTRQLERATDIAVEKAVQLEEATRKIAHLEATAERLADRVRVESMARTAAEQERDELRAALQRANQRAQTASDAADSYRAERDAARTTIDRIAGLVDPQD